METCSTNAEMRRKTKTDLQNWAETRNTSKQMCRKMKTGLKEELISEFLESLNDKLNEQPMRSGEPMHIHLQDNFTKTSCLKIRACRKQDPKRADYERGVGERTRGNRMVQPSSLGPKGRQREGETMHRLQRA